jgi:DNA-binding GntR family transcriptional regulator
MPRRRPGAPPGDQILRGVLDPGATIEQESLAASLGLSTTPLREALRGLESEQLVVLRAYRDTVVAPVSIEALHEVYTVRANIEPLGAALASHAATPAELEQLEAASTRPGPRTSP